MLFCQLKWFIYVELTYCTFGTLDSKMHFQYQASLVSKITYVLLLYSVQGMRSMKKVIAHLQWFTEP